MTSAVGVTYSSRDQNTKAHFTSHSTARHSATAATATSAVSPVSSIGGAPHSGNPAFSDHAEYLAGIHTAAQSFWPTFDFLPVSQHCMTGIADSWHLAGGNPSTVSLSKSLHSSNSCQAVGPLASAAAVVPFGCPAHMNVHTHPSFHTGVPLVQGQPEGSLGTTLNPARPVMAAGGLCQVMPWGQLPHASTPPPIPSPLSHAPLQSVPTAQLSQSNDPSSHRLCRPTSSLGCSGTPPNHLHQSTQPSPGASVFHNAPTSTSEGSFVQNRTRSSSGEAVFQPNHASNTRAETFQSLTPIIQSQRQLSSPQLAIPSPSAQLQPPQPQAHQSPPVMQQVSSTGHFQDCDHGKPDIVDTAGLARAGLHVEPAHIQQSYTAPVTLQHRALDDGLLLCVLWKGLLMQGKLTASGNEVAGSGARSSEAVALGPNFIAGAPNGMHEMLHSPQQQQHGQQHVVASCDIKPSPSTSDSLVRLH
jgi:hypothetical protein